MFGKGATTISIFSMLLILSGCVNMATSGAQIIYNRHSIQRSVKDQYNTYTAYNALYMKTNQFKDTNISVASYHDEILMVGQAPSSWQRLRAEAVVKEATGVPIIYNLVTVESPSSTLTRLSDTWITSKIKTKLLASNDVDVTQVKVVTEDGVVYLMGVLPQNQALAAVDLASHTDGVLKVVRVFSYITISKSLS